MSIITLLTDFGLSDGYVGIMKGVIWQIAPKAQVVDLTHEIPPQDILAGALTLARCGPFFPALTVHLGVIDPGVGTSRRAIAARLGDQFFVGPDNGLATLLIEKTEGEGKEIEFVQLDQPGFWLEQVSSSFHGRDIFAPVSAHLANGVPLEKLGTSIQDPARLTVPQPQRVPGGWHAQVLHIDHFGNCATNLVEDQLDGMSQAVVEIKGRKIYDMVKSFGERQPGDLIAMIDSDGRMAIAVVNGNAADLLQARVGDCVEVITWSSS